MGLPRRTSADEAGSLTADPSDRSASMKQLAKNAKNHDGIDADHPDQTINISLQLAEVRLQFAEVGLQPHHFDHDRSASMCSYRLKNRRISSIMVSRRKSRLSKRASSALERWRSSVRKS